MITNTSGKVIAFPRLRIHSNKLLPMKEVVNFSLCKKRLINSVSFSM